MNRSGFNVASLVAGVVFILIGALFLLDEYDTIDLNPAIVLPVLVIALGVAIILGGHDS